MATIEYWIQLENRPWDICPHNIDRMTGQNLKDREGKDPATTSLSSPGTGVVRNNVTMFRPLRKSDSSIDDALILRRYKPPQKPDQSDAWTQPDDRKVNPWDLNEPDPTDSGTMGTIPGPVIECNVGDSVVVHFRNMDNRTEIVTKTICFPVPFFGQICFPIPTAVPIAIEKRIHSLHPHGLVFERRSDGAYPLSPPDQSQPIPAAEAAAWAGVPGFSGTFKQGDRVPPGGTFIYTWNTFGWPTTAGVWLYHDHSICDMDNVEHGAIGIIVIHNPADTQQEVDIRAGDPQDPSRLDPNFLPGGSPNGSPVQTFCFPLPFEARILPFDLAGLPTVAPTLASENMPHMPHMLEGKRKNPKSGGEPPELETARTIQRGDLHLELDEKLLFIRRICISRYRTPPEKALYLQLFHSLGDAGMCINGRKYVGNTPTMVAGTSTRMRFGVVGMGSDVHTFHIHGHRWIVPGPHGNTPAAIQGSVMDTPISQFEDTRIFGPANSFVFTIQGQAGSFMRAGGPGADQAIGEWHMHCHVLAHMMTGMMGSLLIINGGELAFPLPVGVPCPSEMTGGGGGMGGAAQKEIDAVNDPNNLTGFAFSPANVTVNKNDSVFFKNNTGAPHSIIWDTAGSPANVPQFDAGASSAPVVMSSPGTFSYHCGIHGANMKGSITVNP